MEKKKANTTSTTTKDAYILWKLTTTELLHGTMLQYYNEPDRKGQLPLYARTTYQNGMPVGTKYTYDRNGAIIKKTHIQ